MQFLNTFETLSIRAILVVDLMKIQVNVDTLLFETRKLL